MQQINAHLHGKDSPPYVINLDPAVVYAPFESNIDIRDSVNYKEVMRQYNLGPNGGILTSLNLFATKVDQIIGLLEKRAAPPPPPPPPTDDPADDLARARKPPFAHILVDTPGQIEAFVWSASGTILLESLASAFPTVIAYVIDTPRTSSTSTFMSNMLYACSILYKTRLPMVLVFNKTDVKDAAFAREWMTDFDAFQAALHQDELDNAFGGAEGGDGQGMGSGYMSSLLNSMSLVLEEFYAHLSMVAVSSLLGTGVDDFFEAVREKAAEFQRDYAPELERRKEQRKQAEREAREQEVNKMMSAMSMGGASGAGAGVKDVKDGAEDADIETFSANSSDDGLEGDGDDDRDGLQARYAAATQGEGNETGAEASFAKYLYTQRQRQ